MAWDSRRNDAIAEAVRGDRGSWDVTLSPLGRWVSLSVAASYLGFAIYTRGVEGGLRTAVFLMLPMASLWFSEGMAGYVGGRLTRASAAPVVRITGWVLLFVPLAIFAFAAMQY